MNNLKLIIYLLLAYLGYKLLFNKEGFALSSNTTDDPSKLDLGKFYLVGKRTTSNTITPASNGGKECVEYNDIRFRIKNKINYVSKSLLKEQKSYKINRLIITINKDINNNITLLNIIKYFSFIYDEINIISNSNLHYLKEYFNYDITILFLNNIDIENINYKNKVIIENEEYNEDEIYKLFNITINELNIII
jgi:hypothetical protein